MEQAFRERIKAYAFFGVFSALAVVYGRIAAPVLEEMLGTATMPATPLAIAAMLISLGSVIPLVVSFRPAAARQLLENMRDKARKRGKQVTLQSAGRTLSFYVAALASTPIMYGIVLVFLTADFTMMLLLIPASLILAVVGWVILGRLLKEMSTLFLR
ncbi:MAG: hypothetical protein KY393_00065 [Actinobacteria bacterium]|nr:hypothetical protein [Actinomycetota bacterium]